MFDIMEHVSIIVVGLAAVISYLMWIGCYSGSRNPGIPESVCLPSESLDLVDQTLDCATGDWMIEVVEQAGAVARVLPTLTRALIPEFIVSPGAFPYVCF